MGPNKQQYNIKHAKIWHTEPGLVALYEMEMVRVYSYNPGTRMGRSILHMTA